MLCKQIQIQALYTFKEKFKGHLVEPIGGHQEWDPVGRSKNA